MSRLSLGWREWVALPDLDIARIKAKIDTGARTSALHAFELVSEQREDGLWVVFSVHPKQRNTQRVIRCEARIKDKRMVRDSGGHMENRFVIESNVRIADVQWPIELTLTARDDMGFRMLLGRSALQERFLVDPDASYLVSRRRKKKKEKPQGDDEHKQGGRS